jgi:hypothetical protein
VARSEGQTTETRTGAPVSSSSSLRTPALVARLRTPEVRRQILGVSPDAAAPPVMRLLQQFDKTFPVTDPPSYEPPAETSVAAQPVARRVPRVSSCSCSSSSHLTWGTRSPHFLTEMRDVHRSYGSITGCRCRRRGIGRRQKPASWSSLGTAGSGRLAIPRTHNARGSACPGDVSAPGIDVGDLKAGRLPWRSARPRKRTLDRRRYWE